MGAAESLLRVALTLPRLTAREARVLELVAAGLTTGQIGGVLTVSAKDVEYHVGHLLQKFESRNRTGLVARAYALGYLEQLTWPPRCFVLPTGRRSRDQRRVSMRRTGEDID